MCDACDNAEMQPPEPIDRSLVDLARKIEAAMPGERVPEAGWAVVFDLSGGAVEWRHFQRIHASYEAARRTASVGNGIWRVAANSPTAEA
jgi:hypothetical protein